MMLLRKSKYFYNSACRLVGCVIKEEENDLVKNFIMAFTDRTCYIWNTVSG